MLQNYWRRGQEDEDMMKYCKISLAILIVPTVINVVIALLETARESLMKELLAVACAVLQLNPIVHGVAMWRGEEQGEDDVMPYVVLFMGNRMIELLFEVLPEVTLQLYVMFKTGEISKLAVFSIASSLLRAAFTMADCSVTSGSI